MKYEILRKLGELVDKLKANEEHILKLGNPRLNRENPGEYLDISKDLADEIKVLTSAQELIERLLKGPCNKLAELAGDNNAIPRSCLRCDLGPCLNAPYVTEVSMKLGKWTRYDQGRSNTLERVWVHHQEDGKWLIETGRITRRGGPVICDRTGFPFKKASSWHPIVIPSPPTP